MVCCSARKETGRFGLIKRYIRKTLLEVPPGFLVGLTCDQQQVSSEFRDINTATNGLQSLGRNDLWGPQDICAGKWKAVASDLLQ